MKHEPTFSISIDKAEYKTLVDNGLDQFPHTYDRGGECLHFTPRRAADRPMICKFLDETIDLGENLATELLK